MTGPVLVGQSPLANAIYAHARKQVTARTDISHHSSRELNIMALAAPVAFAHVLQYARAGKRQCDRLHEISTVSGSFHQEGLMDVARLSRDQTYAEIHFYVVCWNAVGRNLNVLKRVTGLSAVKTACKEHGSSIRHYTKLRNHFEHIDERVPGKPDASGFLTIDENSVGWGWKNDGMNVIVGDDRWDISPESGQKLLGLAHYLIIDLGYELGIPPEQDSLF